MVVKYGIRYLGGNSVSPLGSVTIARLDDNSRTSTAQGAIIRLRNDIKNSSRRPMIIVHEMGHVFGYNNTGVLAHFMKELGAVCTDGSSNIIDYCHTNNPGELYDPGPYAGLDGSTQQYLNMPSDYSLAGIGEDFAETFTVVVSEGYIHSGNKTYIKTAKDVYENKIYNHDIGRRRKVMKAIISGSWKE